MSKTAETSITDTAVRKFLRESKENDELACSKQTGFHLRKVKNGGSWRYRYADAAGKRRVKVIGRYPALKAPEAAWFASEWRREGRDPLAEKKEVREAALSDQEGATRRTVGYYLDHQYGREQARKKDGGSGTMARIKSVFRDLLERDMASLTKADIFEWQAAREEAGIAHATLQRDYGALKTMVRHAYKNGVLEVFPLQDVTLQAPTFEHQVSAHSIDKQGKRRMLTDAERDGLFNGLEAWDQELREQRRNSRAHGRAYLPSLDDVAFAHWFVPFCHLAFHTGLRVGDLYSLTWAELNIVTGRLQKFPEKTLHTPNPIKVDLPLNGEIHQVMIRWWEQCGRPGTGLVFSSPKSGVQLSRDAHKKPWANVKRLGLLPKSLVFYSLRHNFISTLLHLGVQVFEVARMVGHKSSAMIENHYGHLCPAAAATAMEAFARNAAKKGERL